MVILFLIVLWAIVLGPSLYRRWTEGRVGDSIGEFHSHLNVLHRTHPGLVTPAHVLDEEYPATSAVGPLPPPARSVPVVRVLRTGTDPSPFTAPAPSDLYRPTYPAVPAALMQPPPRATAPMRSFARQGARKRRRDTIRALTISIASCLALGAVPALRPLWLIAVVAGAALVAYMALLVRFEINAVERREKVRVLPAIRNPRAMRASRYVMVGSDGPSYLGEDEDSVVVISAAGGA